MTQMNHYLAKIINYGAKIRHWTYAFLFFCTRNQGQDRHAVRRLNQLQRQCRSKVGPSRDKKSLLTLPWQQNLLMTTNPKFTQKENSRCFKKENENFCVVFTYSMKRAREIRKFHIAVIQGWLKSLMYEQSCCLANINLRIFLPFLLPSPWSYLSSPEL